MHGDSTLIPSDTCEKFIVLSVSEEYFIDVVSFQATVPGISVVVKAFVVVKIVVVIKRDRVVVKAFVIFAKHLSTT